MEHKFLKYKLKNDLLIPYIQKCDSYESILEYWNTLENFVIKPELKNSYILPLNY